MLGKLLGSVFGLKGIAIAVAVAFTAGALGGGFAVRKLWKGDVAATRVANLQRQLEATTAANRITNERYALDRATLEELQRRFRDVQEAVSSGECLPAADTDRLRELLRPPSNPGSGPR